jgi:hypothetical protein
MNFQTIKTAIQTTHPDATDQQIKAAIKTVDTNALTAAETPRWTHEIWDRTTPINGVPAANVLAQRDDIASTGEIVLISLDGNIVMLQPHDPTQPGFAPIADGAATGTQMTAQAVTESVDSQTLALVADAITDAQA